MGAGGRSAGGYLAAPGAVPGPHPLGENRAAPTCAGAAYLRVAAPLPLGLATLRDYRITLLVLPFWYRKVSPVKRLYYILSSLFLNSSPLAAAGASLLTLLAGHRGRCYDGATVHRLPPSSNASCIRIRPRPRHQR